MYDEDKAALMKTFDTMELEQPGELQFHEFLHLHQMAPHLLFPAFRVQQHMMRCSMGIKFWENQRVRAAEQRAWNYKTEARRTEFELKKSSKLHRKEMMKVKKMGIRKRWWFWKKRRNLKLKRVIDPLEPERRLEVDPSSNMRYLCAREVAIMEEIYAKKEEDRERKLAEKAAKQAAKEAKELAKLQGEKNDLEKALDEAQTETIEEKSEFTGQEQTTLRRQRSMKRKRKRIEQAGGSEEDVIKVEDLEDAVEGGRGDKPKRKHKQHSSKNKDKQLAGQSSSEATDVDADSKETSKKETTGPNNGRRASQTVA